MKKENLIKIWFCQIRGPFLILSVVLVLLGFSAAYRDGYHNWSHFLILLFGVMCAHISVDLFNELSDYRTKIDAHTVRTPFSGGSGMLQSGKVSPSAVSAVAYGTLVMAGAIGLYFCFVSGWLLLLFIISGGVAIRYYTTHLVRWLIGEVAAGLHLGTLVVLGVYYALTSRLTVEIVLISIPPGILTALLLLLNEFPDAAADEIGGRRHLVIQFGKKICSKIYVWSMVVLYLVILMTPITVDVPYTILIAWVTLPLAIKAGLTVLERYDDTPNLTAALGMNVGVVILTDLFMAIGMFL